jgi:ABC-2 type transport system ATP-binding protein
MDNCLVEINGLTKVYGSNAAPAVNNISLKLPRGKIIGLLGPNGSGKTTLIKMMNGLLTPTSGEIKIAGMPVGTETKSHVAYLPDRTYLSGGQKISDVLDFFCDFYSDFERNRALGMLENLGISPDSKMQTLSKGTKEKVQLILVMSRDADLFILDEPIAGVDPAARDYIIRTIINNYNPDASIILCTHLISDIETILDDVVFIKQGHLVLQASADEIRQQQGKTVDAYFREVFAC